MGDNTNKASVKALTIANGQSLSAGVYCGRLALVGIEMPAGWDTAGLSLQFARDNGGVAGTYCDVWDWTGVEFVLSVAQGRFIPFDARAGLVLEWVKVRSGTSGTPVNQTAARVINLLTRAVA